MSSRAEAYRSRARDCEAAANRVVADPQVRATYLEMAACWRRMAEQQEEIEKTLANHGS